jgi:hypothetical protein
MPDFADPNLGLKAAPASALPSAVMDAAAFDCTSWEAMFAVALPEDALSQGCRLSVAADASSGRCCDGRPGAVAATGRSLLAVLAGLLSISAEKLSGAGDWSARADLDGAF